MLGHLRASAHIDNDDTRMAGTAPVAERELTHVLARVVHHDPAVGPVDQEVAELGGPDGEPVQVVTCQNDILAGADAAISVLVDEDDPARFPRGGIAVRVTATSRAACRLEIRSFADLTC